MTRRSAHQAATLYVQRVRTALHDTVSALGVGVSSNRCSTPYHSVKPRRQTTASRPYLARAPRQTRLRFSIKDEYNVGALLAGKHDGSLVTFGASEERDWGYPEVVSKLG